LYHAVRCLYLHGFASGPSSTKGVAFERHFAGRHEIVRMDLRVPSLEHLRLSAMIDRVAAAVEPGDVLIGSSLGGLTAARVAEKDPRVAAVVLMAPAFGIIDRWRDVLGAEFDDWQRAGWRTITDYTTGQPARVDFAFVEDAAAIDVGLPSVTQPALLLHGRADDVVPIERSRAFARAHPHARLVELDDGHELIASLPVLLSETAAFLAATAP
jgi:pimeloyl-ACP methyl ester carboxylesterase